MNIEETGDSMHFSMGSPKNPFPQILEVSLATNNGYQNNTISE